MENNITTTTMENIYYIVQIGVAIVISIPWSMYSFKKPTATQAATTKIRYAMPVASKRKHLAILQNTSPDRQAIA